MQWCWLPLKRYFFKKRNENIIQVLKGTKDPRGSVTPFSLVVVWMLDSLCGISSCLICCYCSVAQSCLTLCDPMDCSMPGFPAIHHLLELAQTHVHQISDAIQPSHPLLFPSPAFSLSQPQGLFYELALASGGQSIGASASASVLPVNIQDWFSSGVTGLVSLQSKGLMWAVSFMEFQWGLLLMNPSFK